MNEIIIKVVVVIIIIIIIVVVFLFVVVVNTFQTRKPDALPEILKTWEFLPLWMRSLGPMDRVICAPICGMCCKKKSIGATTPSSDSTTASSSGSKTNLQAEV